LWGLVRKETHKPIVSDPHDNNSIDIISDPQDNNIGKIIVCGAGERTNPQKPIISDPQDNNNISDILVCGGW
jgi:hypothetical protein